MNNEISNRFNIPVRNLQNWKKEIKVHGDFTSASDWREKLYLNLEDILKIETYIESSIYKIFTKEEIELMVASTNGVYFKAEYAIENNWLNVFSDYCYNQYFNSNINYKKFLNDETSDIENEDKKLESQAKVIVAKYKQLDTYEKFLLLRRLWSYWESKELPFFDTTR